MFKVGSAMAQPFVQAASAFEQRRTDIRSPMSVAVRPPRTIGQRIAGAAHAFEKRRTKHGRKWVAVFMNEDTIVIALHASLTATEKALTQRPAGLAQALEFHRQLFSDASALLLRKIKSITGMVVRQTSAEIDPMTGSVVHLFTTDTLGENFPLSPGGVACPSML
jgi:uncharacterized protein YbcI